MIKIIKIIGFFFVLIMLSGCWISHFGNSPRWYYNRNSIDFKQELRQNITDPDIIINISRLTKQLTLPFIFIDWDVKNYSLDLNFHTNDSSLNLLDSVEYSILDINDSLLNKGIIVGHGFRDYRTFAQSDYIIAISKNERDIKVNLIVYLRNREGKQTKSEYKYQLKKINQRWFQIGLFYV